MKTKCLSAQVKVLTLQCQKVINIWESVEMHHEEHAFT
jgi:hypothetical protein